MILSTITTVLAAAEQAAAEHEKSELPFFLAGGVLASFAVIISVIGFTKPDFPGDSTAARGVMALSITLVAAAMISIVYVST